MDTIYGTLTDRGPMSGTLTPVSTSGMSGRLTPVSTSGMSGSLSIAMPQYDYYTGDTVVIPKARSGTILETAGKTMREDIMVTEVPYFETSNESGGETVYIAREV